MRTYYLCIHDTCGMRLYTYLFAVTVSAAERGTPYIRADTSIYLHVYMYLRTRIEVSPLFVSSQY